VCTARAPKYEKTQKKGEKKKTKRTGEGEEIKKTKKLKTTRARVERMMESAA
jgi:hypothetical protein